MIEKRKLSQSQEEYLEAIYLISQKKKAVRVKDLVNRLKVKSASVIGALKKLEKNNLVEHEPYGDIELTKAGLERAKSIFEKHQVLYKFLTDVLKVNPDIADNDACIIEHHISNETFQKMIEFIKETEIFLLQSREKSGEAETADITLQVESGQPQKEFKPNLPQQLIDFKEGARVRIENIDAGSGARVHLKNLGLHIGSVIEIRRASYMKGPMVIFYRDTEVALGHRLAAKILARGV